MIKPAAPATSSACPKSSSSKEEIEPIEETSDKESSDKENKEVCFNSKPLKSSQILAKYTLWAHKSTN